MKASKERKKKRRVQTQEDEELCRKLREGKNVERNKRQQRAVMLSKLFNRTRNKQGTSYRFFLAGINRVWYGGGESEASYSSLAPLKLF